MTTEGLLILIFLSLIIGLIVGIFLGARLTRGHFLYVATMQRSQLPPLPQSRSRSRRLRHDEDDY